MFQKAEMTTGWWLFIYIPLIIFWVWTLIDLIKNADWKEVVVFIFKIILTIPILLWCDAVNLWAGTIVSMGWWFLAFNKYK
jgi:hypothetical protein